MTRRREQSGYALLLVIAMAGAIAMMLYSQLPRVAFESMRAKEELLIERGEQYTRAIQLFVAKNKRYPKDMDELEKFGGTRYLRKRFRDPFTGSDEWRVINVDANGQLTDSLVKKKEETKENRNTFITEFAGLGQTDTTFGNTGVNVALRRRPSDGAIDNGSLPLPSPYPPASSEQPEPQQPAPPPFLHEQEQQQDQQNVSQPQPLDPQQQAPPPDEAAVEQPADPSQDPQQPDPGSEPDTAPPAFISSGGIQQPPQQQQPPGFPQQQTLPDSGQQQQPYPAPPGFQQQSAGFPPQQIGAQQNVGAQAPPTPPGAPGGFGAPGPGSNPALSMIRDALTKPNPNIPMNLAPGLQLGPGIAGFASKHEGAAIKIYNEQQEYHKWEFIYDPRQDSRIQQELAGAMPQQPGAPQLPGSQPRPGSPQIPGGGMQPMQPTTPPMQPTTPPMQPTTPPMQPTRPPMQPGFPPQQGPGISPPPIRPGMPPQPPQTMQPQQPPPRPQQPQPQPQQPSGPVPFISTPSTAPPQQPAPPQPGANPQQNPEGPAGLPPGINFPGRRGR